MKDGALGALGERVQAPFGRRSCRVTGNSAHGGYRIFSLVDETGPAPAPGQFYMLSAATRWEESGGRPFLPRAFSVARSEPSKRGVRLDFLAEPVGPGTSRLSSLAEGEEAWINGPLGRPFSMPREISEEAAGAILVGGGIGIAPMAILRRGLTTRGIPTRVLLGFRDEPHSGGVDELFGCEEVRLASEDGHAGHRGYVTDLLAVMLSGDDSATAVVYACGPPGMLEAVRLMCAENDVGCELAMESPMACGFGACFGCAVPLADGGYMRLCVDGPVVRGDEIETAAVSGAGHR